jgi:6-pyruvoyltetrahydropterin/6-carboxytetrahydropterin synthase
VLLAVIEEFDHMNFNLDLPYFRDRIPTSENIARVLWAKLAAQSDIGTLDTIRLYEDEDLYAEITAAGGLDVASVTRRYSFTALLDGRQGHTWDCFVSVHGLIDAVTGMVTDIGALDRLVHERVVRTLDRQDLRNVLNAPSITGAHLAEFIWNSLVSRLSSGTLQNIHVVQSRDHSFDYHG